MVLENLTSTTPFFDNGSITDREPTSDPDKWKTNMWFIMFLVLTILGVIGNVAITWIVWAHRSMKTITNVFIGNMGFGGLLMTMLAFPFLFPYNSFPLYWHMPGFCKMYEFATTMGVCVFAFSLMMMAIERYYALTSPDEDATSVRFRPSFKIWFSSFLIAIPSWFFATLDNVAISPDETIGFCDKQWPDFLGNRLGSYIYLIFLTATFYFIPVGVMVYRNGQLFLKLWSHKSADLNAVDKASQKRTVIMMIVQVIVFIILWFPYSVSSVLIGDIRTIIALSSADLIITFYWMAMSSIVLYPIIYICMEERFQKKLKKAFRWCPCIDYEAKAVNYKLSNAEQTIEMVERYTVIHDV